MTDIVRRGAEPSPKTAFVCHTDPEIIEIITLYLDIIGWESATFDKVPERVTLVPSLLFIDNQQGVPLSFLKLCPKTRICSIIDPENEISKKSRTNDLLRSILTQPISIQDLEQIVVEAM